MKNLKLIAGIILHPFKCIVIAMRQERDQAIIVGEIRERAWRNNHERMHNMSAITNTAYTSSELYSNLYAGAPNYRR